jgi:hypothetical protein
LFDADKVIEFTSEAEFDFAVIARSEATKQSRAKERLPARPWFASLRSQ